MTLWRVLPWDASAGVAEPGGALWFPRGLQGSGRHDNPDRYACLYASERAASAVAEALAAFRGAGELRAAMLARGGRQLALAEIALPDGAELVDLDEPATLARESLRPSGVATHARSATQAQAARLHERHPDAAGLRWWSTLESSWINATVFDRFSGRLVAAGAEPLTGEHPAVAEAAELLGLA